jgi:hypothetical protein
MNTRLADWTEWKARCALDLCPPETRRRLHAYAQQRFLHYLRKYIRASNATNARAATPSAPDAWHLLESHMTVNTTRSGKRYKDWLFARRARSGEDLLDVVQGGATLIVREVVRRHLRREFSPRNFVSAQTSLPQHPDAGITIQDLLPASHDFMNDAACRELLQMAAQHADRLYPTLKRRDRLVLLARLRGMSFKSSRTVAFTGCSRNTMRRTLNAVVVQVSDRLASEYRREDPQTLRLLIHMTIQALCETVEEKEKWARTHTRSFKRVKEECPA